MGCGPPFAVRRKNCPGDQALPEGLQIPTQEIETHGKSIGTTGTFASCLQPCTNAEVTACLLHVPTVYDQNHDPAMPLCNLLYALLDGFQKPPCATSNRIETIQVQLVPVQ